MLVKSFEPWRLDVLWATTAIDLDKEQLAMAAIQSGKGRRVYKVSMAKAKAVVLLEIRTHICNS